MTSVYKIMASSFSPFQSSESPHKKTKTEDADDADDADNAATILLSLKCSPSPTTSNENLLLRIEQYYQPQTIKLTRNYFLYMQHYLSRPTPASLRLFFEKHKSPIPLHFPEKDFIAIRQAYYLFFSDCFSSGGTFINSAFLIQICETTLKIPKLPKGKHAFFHLYVSIFERSGSFEKTGTEGSNRDLGAFLRCQPRL